jgi:hypothetical protein
MREHESLLDAAVRAAHAERDMEGKARYENAIARAEAAEALAADTEWRFETLFGERNQLQARALAAEDAVRVLREALENSSAALCECDGCHHARDALASTAHLAPETAAELRARLGFSELSEAQKAENFRANFAPDDTKEGA